MPFFGKSLTDLRWEDLQELLQEGAEETVRLEFKEQVPDRDEAVKKISGLANTFGGYMIVGAREKDGKLVELPGVPEVPRFDQTLVQWCFEQLYPPLTPLVSHPIPVDGAKDRFIFVVFVELSLEAPHFLTKRQGCYIRTDEYSQRFKPQLATLAELRYLLDRREVAVQRRNYLVERADHRFESHKARAYKPPKEAPPNPPSLRVLAIPQFPGVWACDPGALRLAVKNEQIPARGMHFPDGRPESQPGGVYLLRPQRVGFSYLELDIEGLIYHRQMLELSKTEDAPRVLLLHLPHVFAWVVFYARYFTDMYQHLGYNGTLLVEVQLEGVSGLPISKPWSHYGDGTASEPRLDNVIHTEVAVSADELRTSRAASLRKLHRELAFASGCAEAFEVGEEAVDTWLQRGYEFLNWKSVDG